MALAGAVIVLLMLLAALLAPWIAPHHYEDQFKDEWAQGLTQGPSRRHLLGLDPLTRDVLSRVLYGARVSLEVAVAATAVSVLIGVVVGAISGYCGRWIDESLMRIADMFSAFPGILLAIAVTAAFDAAFGTRPFVLVFVALGLVGWAGLARIVRGRVLSLREEDFVHAACAMGAGRARIIFRHILPNAMASVIVTATVLMAGNILGEAGLSFLGIGVQPPHPSWGGMLANVRTGGLLHWWMCAFPGAAIALTVLGFNLLGDGRRDALDPQTPAEAP